MIPHLIAFGSMFLMDFSFAYYARRAAQGKAHQASSWASILILFNCVVMIYVVEDPYTMPSAMAGAYLGTYLAVRRDAK